MAHIVDTTVMVIEVRMVMVIIRQITGIIIILIILIIINNIDPALVQEPTDVTIMITTMATVAHTGVHQAQAILIRPLYRLNRTVNATIRIVIIIRRVTHLIEV